MPSFLVPEALWALASVPALVAVYLRVLRRPARVSLLHSQTAVLAGAMVRGGVLRRHVPALLLLAGWIAAVAAVARPTAPLPVPADRSTVILSLDTSGSMRSDDIEPNRLEAAKAAARDFVHGLPPRLRVGLVMFGGYAALVVPPVTDHARVIEAIDGLGFIRRTAIGDGLLEAVAALPGRARPGPDGSLAAPDATAPPGIVVLLSDGRSNAGMDSLEAAEIARRQRVTVYTVGVGQRVTPQNAWALGGPLDEETLQAIADHTGGRYFHASTAAGLRDVYRGLARTVAWERRPEEVSAVLAALSAVALILAAVVSLRTVRSLGL